MSAGRTAVATTGVLAVALLACGSQGRQVVRRYERVGASPPVDGPRAVGPVTKEDRGSLQAGATVARVRTLEPGVDGARSNVVTEQAYHVGYFHGVSRGLELGGAAMLAHTDSAEPVASDAPASRLEPGLFGGGALSLRGVITEDRVLFLVGTSELAFWALPYHERLTESVGGGPFEEKTSVMRTLSYLQLRAGLSAGVRASPTVSVAAGFLAQNYPIFQSATLSMTCYSECSEDAPDTTEMGTALTSFMWVSYAPGPLSLSLQLYETASASHRLRSSQPFGGTLVLGYTFDWSDARGSWKPAELRGPL